MGAVVRAGLVQQHWTGDKDSMIAAAVARICAFTLAAASMAALPRP